MAREMCDKGRVLVNGHEAKPAKEVKQGDVVTLRFSSRIIEIDILGLPAASSKKTHPEEWYRVKSDTRLRREKDLWNENLS